MITAKWITNSYLLVGSKVLWEPWPPLWHIIYLLPLTLHFLLVNCSIHLPAISLAFPPFFCHPVSLTIFLATLVSSIQTIMPNQSYLLLISGARFCTICTILLVPGEVWFSRFLMRSDSPDPLLSYQSIYLPQNFLFPMNHKYII